MRPLVGIIALVLVILAFVGVAASYIVLASGVNCGPGYVATKRLTCVRHTNGPN